MEGVKPFSRVTLSEQVVMRIADMISAGKWKPGEKLPPEPEICQAFQIGRSTLREATKALAFMGLIEKRHGEGTYVTNGPSTLLERIFKPGLLTPENVNDLCEARMALESELVVLCAQRASSEDLERLESLVREMRLTCNTDSDRHLQDDLDFHLSIAAYSRNQVLAHSLRTIREVLHELIKKSNELPGAQELACRQHAQIVEALKQHNTRKARSMMRTHLSVFQRRYKMLLRAAQPASLLQDGFHEHEQTLVG